MFATPLLETEVNAEFIRESEDYMHKLGMEILTSVAFALLVCVCIYMWHKNKSSSDLFGRILVPTGITMLGNALDMDKGKLRYMLVKLEQDIRPCL